MEARPLVAGRPLFGLGSPADELYIIECGKGAFRVLS